MLILFVLCHGLVYSGNGGCEYEAELGLPAKNGGLADLETRAVRGGC
jgi:hypothetical protein